jgi:hypothetical protein
VSDEQQFNALKELLARFTPQPDIPDRWRWVSGSLDLFSVKSGYNLLLQSWKTMALDSNLLVAIQKLWKNDVPSKVILLNPPA